jgi:ABC-type transport system involved in cytochrome c biogenesis permease component
MTQELFYILVIFGLYFLPTFIGLKKRNSTAICMLNLFLGWTVIGWIIALVWALTVDTPATAAPSAK